MDFFCYEGYYANQEHVVGFGLLGVVCVSECKKLGIRTSLICCTKRASTHLPFSFCLNSIAVVR